MRFDAVPTTGVNEVKFGMNREEVRRLLGSATEFINLMMMSTRQMTSDFVMYFMMTIMNVKRLKFLMKLKYM